MTRVSLREAYDNKDVVAQILSIRDTAESAEDASEQAVTTANTASDHVDALVPQVEGAVENANSASASAQASAQTVAGYENRLANVEDTTENLSGDLNAVTLRVTTAEGQIVTIQGRVTALETADGNNVKITGTHAIGNYAVLLTGNQTGIAGLKEFVGDIYKKQSNFDPKYRPASYVGLYPPLLRDFENNDIIRYRLDMSSTSQTVGWQIYQTNNQGTRKAIVLGFRVNKATGACSLVLVKTDGQEATLASWQDDGMKDA